jgi:hypothetical protein
MSNHPVVVYGASGYTGRLVAEYLREYSIPFVAAGRDRKRIEESMKLVPGIETADYRVVEVEHDVRSLTQLFDGASVVLNTVGPFTYFGEPVVAACAEVGAHYLDSTGEQEWMLKMRNEYGARFKEKNVALAPSVAYMHTIGQIACEIVLEQEGIDTLEVGCLTNGVPTYGSTQTIFCMFQSEHLYLADNKLVPWVKGRGFEMVAPGMATTVLCHPWGGGAIPLAYMDDPRVINCRHLTAFDNRPMFEMLIALQKNYEENIKPLPAEQREKALADLAAKMQPGMPPRERLRTGRSTDFAHGRGAAVSRSCVIRSTPPYQITGLLMAAAARKLMDDGTQQAGFTSACRMVGHRYLLGAVRNFFPIDVQVS